MVIKLNLGSGADYREGYNNIDSDPKFKPDLIGDVRKLNYADDSVDEILARDILEHISHREVLDVLKEWYRVLKKGGKLIIQIPNLFTICKHIIEIGDKITLTQTNTFSGKGVPFLNDYIRKIFGGQEYEGNFHKNGFTPDTIMELFEKVGFRDIKIFHVKDLKTPDYPTNMVIEAIK